MSIIRFWYRDIKLPPAQDNVIPDPDYKWIAVLIDNDSKKKSLTRIAKFITSGSPIGVCSVGKNAKELDTRLRDDAVVQTKTFWTTRCATLTQALRIAVAWTDDDKHEILNIVCIGTDGSNHRKQVKSAITRL